MVIVVPQFALQLLVFSCATPLLQRYESQHCPLVRPSTRSRALIEFSLSIVRFVCANRLTISNRNCKYICCTSKIIAAVAVVIVVVVVGNVSWLRYKILLGGVSERLSLPRCSVSRLLLLTQSIVRYTVYVCKRVYAFCYSIALQI